MSFRLNSRELLFPVPLFAFELEDSGPLNEVLVAELERRREQEPGVARSNRGGWHSAPDWFDRDEPGHRCLAGHLRNAVREATAGLVPSGEAQRLKFVFEGWANFAESGDHHAPHDHPGAFWSGVYYIAAPEEGGEIEFLSGRGGDPNAGLLSVPMNWDYFRVMPKAGVLLLFPGHLRHWVAPHQQGTPRLSMAFNARLMTGR